MLSDGIIHFSFHTHALRNAAALAPPRCHLHDDNMPMRARARGTGPRARPQSRTRHTNRMHAVATLGGWRAPTLTSTCVPPCTSSGPHPDLHQASEIATFHTARTHRPSTAHHAHDKVRDTPHTPAAATTRALTRPLRGRDDCRTHEPSCTTPRPPQQQNPQRANPTAAALLGTTWDRSLELRGPSRTLTRSQTYR